MKQFVIAFLFSAFCISQAGAQTFIDKLKDNSGDSKGKVTVKQSSKIDELVNGRAAAPAPKKKSMKDSLTVKKHIDGKKAANDSTSLQKIPAGERSYTGYGYRVQVYAGNNSRASRNKARSIGEQLKAQFPGHKVYVHFYSPRWICRIGNFSNRQDADAMLEIVKDLGFYQACLVRGKISVRK